jgi:membrane protease YdiL (CAAX protease family)
VDDSTPHPSPEPLAPAFRPLPLAAVCTALGLGLFLTFGAASQLLNAAFGIWFTEIFIFVGVPWMLLRVSRYEPLTYTGAHSQALAPAALGFALGVTNFFAFVVPLQYASQSIAPQWLRDMFDSSRIFEGQSPLELGFLLAGVSLAAPVCEEFFFRGVVQKGLLSSSLSRVGAVVVTAVVFSAFHMDPVGFAARVELGVLFGLLRLYTGSLWPGILAHSANNVVSSLLFLTARQMKAAPSGDELPSVSGVLLLTLAGLGAMGSLLAIARTIPALWGPRQEPRPLTLPAPSFTRLVLPWVLGATLSLGALVLVDMRGIRLSFFDLEHRLPKLPKNAPNALEAERAHLLQLREQARTGQLPLEAYEEERTRQARAHPAEKPSEKQ